MFYRKYTQSSDKSLLGNKHIYFDDMEKYKFSRNKGFHFYDMKNIEDKTFMVSHVSFSEIFIHKVTLHFIFFVFPFSFIKYFFLHFQF